MDQANQQEKDILVAIRGVSKKFCMNLRYNMYYGMVDMLRQSVGMPVGKTGLRSHEFYALRDISLDIYNGQIVAFIGANGSGKTTLMRLISGIYALDTGQIEIRDIGRVTSIFALNAGLNPLFTGMENIYLKGAMFGMDREEIQKKLDFIIEFSELEEFLQSPVGNYSSGMRARLAYSVAIATEPGLFIIDEALAVGDAVFKAKCYEHLQDYVKAGRRAVIYVTNRISKVINVANRVIILDHGSLIYDSPDAAAGLEFYIENCLRGLDEKTRNSRMKRIREFEM
jgi:ABC-type polysaccharide/polyol phosphate transport system ATPase subunit